MGWCEQRECVREMWPERAWNWGQVQCGGMEWFGYTERMENEEFVKVYLSSVEGPNRRGRPLGWEDRVEYVSERGVRGNGLEWAKREYMDRGRWRIVCSGHSLGGLFQRE